MALIRCEGCQAVIESTMVACLACGRCPGCGQFRLEGDVLAPACAECGASHCIGCGRCHRCGADFDPGVKACSCGHPNDLDKLRVIEKSFVIEPVRGGCLRTVSSVLVLCVSLLAAAVICAF